MLGAYIRDKNLNVYKVLDQKSENTHSNKPSSYQVECLAGPNSGKIRWISRSVIMSGDFDVSYDI